MIGWKDSILYLEQINELKNLEYNIDYLIMIFSSLIIDN